MKILFFILTFMSLTAFGKPAEKFCQAGQAKQILQAKKQAVVEADKLIRNMDKVLARTDMTWLQKRKFFISKSILKCAKYKLGTLNFVCGDIEGEYTGWTNPFLSNKVFIEDDFFTPVNPKFKEALLLHEATHHCGTNDASYFDISKRPDDVGVIGWQIVADTYTYWVMHGFCYPGYC